MNTITRYKIIVKRKRDWRSKTFHYEADSLFFKVRFASLRASLRRKEEIFCAPERHDQGRALTLVSWTKMEKTLLRFSLRAFLQRIGLGVVALISIERNQVVADEDGIGMLPP